ncbi:ATP-binding protein [Bradyrhizobium genomosp. I (2014)]|uniref:ATP-binding protein n=1 Tax=Bradyrhizobium genomosp. I (2014) TaxID=2683269 RepID=UPI0004ADC132|nr:ATP-binding protein [Bradyrhizobium sp. CCBAU 43298]
MNDGAQRLSEFANPEARPEASARLARDMGGEAFIVFLKDEETGSFTPAQGFNQRLPGGPSWRAFLKQASRSSEFAGEVAFPDPDTLIPAVSHSAHGAIFVFVGQHLRVRWGDLEPALPLLIELLKSEARVQIALARERSAQEVAIHATNLAKALDGARKDVSAASLRLQQLNATLEQRVAEEVARRNEAEAALHQAQKLEAIGQLTGGVAHDFNNLLTVIMGGLETIGRQIGGMSDVAQFARVMRAQAMAHHAAQRAATLTARLLAFSRRQPLDPKSINVDHLLAGMRELLDSTLGERIRVEVVGNAGLWSAFADASELEHAILNLAVNARDAMPEGGRLTIETGNTWLDDDYVAALPEPVPPGQYVLVAVTDTGIGMDRATVDRVFEPFFTTKEVGKGTGLGLSQVYGFVRQTGGHIRIYSEPGQGTAVKIYLPRSQTDADQQVTRLPPAATMLGGNEAILVVEDHDDLRAYSCGVLRDLGYQVFEAADAKSAIAFLETSRPLDLLFTDVVLPDRLHGKNVADHARRLHPKIKILFTTGYTRNAIVHDGRLDAGVNLLSKPFTFRALAEKVRKILDER